MMYFASTWTRFLLIIITAALLNDDGMTSSASGLSVGVIRERWAALKLYKKYKSISMIYSGDRWCVVVGTGQ